MTSESDTYNQQLSVVGGKDGPRYFHKGLMHALACIWVSSRPDMKSNDCVKDLLICPSTKINRKATHPLQNMNNASARAIKHKLPMRKLVKRWNKISMKKREKIKNKYVAETMKSFVKYLFKKVRNGVLVVNGLCESAIEWNETLDMDVDIENQEGSHHQASFLDNTSLAGPAIMYSPKSHVSETGENDCAYSVPLTVASETKVYNSPSSDTKHKIKNDIIKKLFIKELNDMKTQINSILDEKIAGLN